jgi:hypothetical protein
MGIRHLHHHDAGWTSLGIVVLAIVLAIVMLVR